MMLYMLLYYCTLFCIDVFCSWEEKKKRWRFKVLRGCRGCDHEFKSHSCVLDATYEIKFVSDLRQVLCFLRILRFSPAIKLTTTIKRKYCWFSGVKHHNPKPVKVLNMHLHWYFCYCSLEMFISTFNSNSFFSSPCQRQSELMPSLGIRRLLTFHILIFSSETD